MKTIELNQGRSLSAMSSAYLLNKDLQHVLCKDFVEKHFPNIAPKFFLLCSLPFEGSKAVTLVANKKGSKFLECDKLAWCPRGNKTKGDFFFCPLQKAILEELDGKIPKGYFKFYVAISETPYPARAIERLPDGYEITGWGGTYEHPLFSNLRDCIVYSCGFWGDRFGYRGDSSNWIYATRKGE